MTTTPKPTAAEHERVLAFFQSEEACAFGDDLTKALCYLDLKAQLAESERAREALAAAIRDAADEDATVEDYFELADAVLRLFAAADATEPLVTSDNEPPVPLPEVLPAKTRWWTETLESARFDPKLAGGRYVFSDGTTLRPSVIDWSHYRAQQRAAEPSPQPGGFLDALTRRVAELEGRAEAAEESIDRIFARIEREERAKFP